MTMIKQIQKLKYNSNTTQHKNVLGNNKSIQGIHPPEDNITVYIAISIKVLLSSFLQLAGEI
jgi:hypothetical protein